MDLPHAKPPQKPGPNLGGPDSDGEVRLDRSIKAQPFLSSSPKREAYTSPAVEFSRQARKLCEPYRRAYGALAKLNACMDCKLDKCIVPEGNK